LQIPVKSEDINLPFVKFTSISSNILNFSGDSYKGWQVSCTRDNPISQCEFSKNENKIFANLVSSKYEVTFDLRGNFSDCRSCDGRCISSSQICISQELNTDLEDLLKNYGLISLSINELLSSYRITSFGKSEIKDIVPESLQDIDWKAAMKQELKRLKQENVLFITDSDIDKISQLASQGKAGQNSRIVYGEDSTGNKKWIYYYETKFPVITDLNNCQEYPKSLMPTGLLVFSGQEISTYYLVPIVITISLIVLLFILVVTARIVASDKRKSHIKPIMGLQSSS
jgi:hypothetical protein